MEEAAAYTVGEASSLMMLVSPYAGLEEAQGFFGLEGLKDPDPLMLRWRDPLKEALPERVK